MIVFLLRMLFWAVSTVANLVSLALFRAVAGLIVLAVQAVKVPAGAVDGAVQQAGGLFRSGLEQLVELLKDALLSLLSNAFDVLVGTATGSVNLTTSAAGELMEKTREMMEGLSEIFPEAFEGFTEMVGKMIGDLWSNYKHAVEYVIKNV